MISIITACYNASRTIESAFKSLDSQTYRDFEHIVIDGGSKDGTADLIKERAGRLAYWVSEPDKGLADAWNKGIKAAKGDIIGLLNADDVYGPGALEAAADALKPGEMALTYGDAVMFSEDIDRPESVFPGAFRKEFLYNGFGFMHTTCFVTKRVYDVVGEFDTRYRIGVDTDFLLRCVGRGVDFRKIESTTFMRTGGMSQSQYKKAYMEYLLQLRRHGYSKLRIGSAWLQFMLRDAMRTPQG